MLKGARKKVLICRQILHQSHRRLLSWKIHLHYSSYKNPLTHDCGGSATASGTVVNGCEWCSGSFSRIYRSKMRRMPLGLQDRLRLQNYPELTQINTPHLLWCCNFINRLVEEERLSDALGSEGERLKDLRKIITNREEREQWMEVQRASDQLEAEQSEERM
jgi:hypothetical protein